MNKKKKKDAKKGGCQMVDVVGEECRSGQRGWLKFNQLATREKERKKTNSHSMVNLS